MGAVHAFRRVARLAAGERDLRRELEIELRVRAPEHPGVGVPGMARAGRRELAGHHARNGRARIGGHAAARDERRVTLERRPVADLPIVEALCADRPADARFPEIREFPIRISVYLARDAEA